MSTIEHEHKRDPDKGRSHVLRRVAISDEARRSKPFFSSVPPREKVREIKQFIDQTGRPFDHPDVTHNRPPEGSIPKYLEKFDLAEPFARDPDLHLPCPVCSPDYPKFMRDGKIAWFKAEAVIRVIGGCCFRTLSPEGHEQAIREFEREERRRKAERYLISKLWAVKHLLAAVRDDTNIGRAIDWLHAGIQQALREHAIPLWRNVRGGTLYTERKLVSVGSRSRSESMRREVMCQIRGYELIDPGLENFEFQLRQVEQALARLDFGEQWEAQILAMSEEAQRQTAALLRQALKRWKDCRNAMDEARRLVDLGTLKPLRKWADHQGSTCRFYIDFDMLPTVIVIGVSPNRSTRIAIPVDVREPLAVISVVSLDDDN